LKTILKITISAMLLFAAFSAVTVAQTAEQRPAVQLPPTSPIFTPAELAAKVPPAKADDVKSMDAIMTAIYDVISGPAGTRDWNRFRSLFLPQARFTETDKAPDGSLVVISWSVDEFVHDAGDVFAKEGFYEGAIVNKPDVFGHMAQVFSSYESRHNAGEKPFTRGINTVQLLNDGKRWWVVSILWDSERPDNPLPAKFASK
jgi:hypothetical protein